MPSTIIAIAPAVPPESGAMTTPKTAIATLIPHRRVTTAASR
jgi:hypothetical protein